MLSSDQLEISALQEVTLNLYALCNDALSSLSPELQSRNSFMPAPSEEDANAVINRVLLANRTDPVLEKIREVARQGHARYSLTPDGLLVKDGRLVVPATNFLRTHLIRAVHASQVTAHPSGRTTATLLREKYYWPQLAEDVATYIKACKACRWSHVPRDKKPGLLKPLPIPARAWQDVSIDFKSMPPDKKEFNCVMVVVDRLGKRCFSLPCHKTITAEQAANLYFTHIWRIFGPPHSVVSDRGPQFISVFMDELCRLIGVQQKLSTAYHPQTDGNTEIVNQYLDQRLRPWVNYHQDNWSDLLPCMDWAQATLPHESTGLSPFEIEFGHKAVHHWDWEKRTVDAPAPEQLTRDTAQQYAKLRHDAVRYATDLARGNLSRAQERQATQANKKRREPDFSIGDLVYVTSKGFSTGRPSPKLDQQLYGPYPIESMRGHSYMVKLPDYMKIHNVFHADRLRKATDALPGQVEPEQPPIEVNGKPEWVVRSILDSRLHYGRLQYRAAWEGHDPDSTWYNAAGFMNAPIKVKEFHEAYPAKPGPPLRLDAWLQAYQDNETLEETEQDSRAVYKTCSKRPRRRVHVGNVEAFFSACNQAFFGRGDDVTAAPDLRQAG